MLDERAVDALHEIADMAEEAFSHGQQRRENLADGIIREAIQTSVIENEHLSWSEVHSLVSSKMGTTPPPLLPSPGEPDERAEGVVKMLLLARETADQPVSKQSICGLHEALLGYRRGQVRERIGDYRAGPVFVRTARRTLYEAPNPQDVPRHMEKFIDWCNRPLELPLNCAPSLPRECQNDSLLLAPVKAALGHLWFERIHPFFDGNGRIGRALAEQQLNRFADRTVLLSEAIASQKQRYYNALGTYGKMSQGNDVTSWVSWFIHTSRIARRRWLEIEQNPDVSVH